MEEKTKMPKFGKLNKIVNISELKIIQHYRRLWLATYDPDLTINKAFYKCIRDNSNFPSKKN